eukprot:Gb_24236 [translate_table: standard]
MLRAVSTLRIALILMKTFVFTFPFVHLLFFMACRSSIGRNLCQHLALLQLDRIQSLKEVAKQYGVTKPISVLGPLELDLQKTLDLKKILVSVELYESNEHAALREEVLGQIDQIVKLWVKQITQDKGYIEHMVEESNTKVFTFGSYCLGVHGPTVDIDTLCVGLAYANQEEDFFILLHNILAKMLEVIELHDVLDAHVPVMKFKFWGISVDLSYANIFLHVILEDLDISQDLSIFRWQESLSIMRQGGIKTLRGPGRLILSLCVKGGKGIQEGMKRGWHQGGGWQRIVPSLTCSLIQLGIVFTSKKPLDQVFDTLNQGDVLDPGNVIKELLPSWSSSPWWAKRAMRCSGDGDQGVRLTSREAHLREARLALGRWVASEATRE